MTLYDKETALTYSKNDVALSPGAATTLIPTAFPNLPPGFQGSAVVSSNEAVKAIVNVTNRSSGSLGIAGGKAAAQYQGIDSSQVADTLYFPLVKAGHFGKTTTFYIQNAGTNTVSPIAKFKMRNGDEHTVPMGAIGPNKMAIVSLFDAGSFNPTENNGRVGGLIVEGGTDAKLAGVVLEHFTVENPATILQATRGFTSSDFDTTLFAPVIKNSRFDRFTGIQVQNVTGSPINISVNYKGTAGACANQTFTDSATNVAAGASQTFVQGTGSNLPADCTAVAEITGTGNIVAIVNESYVNGKVPSFGQRAVTSSAIAAKSATTKVNIPLFKDDRFGKRTGMQVQNVGSGTANSIVAEFKCGGGDSFTAISKPQSKAAGDAVLFYHPSTQTSLFESANPFRSADVNCGVTITSDQPIVALANESVTPGESLEQDNNNYEGFNLAP
jgi:hypothetical protein